jgi:hypothetical protein
MKTKATILLGFGLCALVFAQDPKPQVEAKPTHPCLAVSPNGPDGQSGKGPFRTFFYYLESSDLPLKDIKSYYKRKDLEKLENRGVKIVVTTSLSIRGTPNETNPSSTSPTSAGCN